MAMVKIFQADVKEELEDQVNAFINQLTDVEIQYDTVFKPRDDQYDVSGILYSCLVKYREN